MALSVLDSNKHCRHLRSKGMFIEVEPYPQESSIPDMTTGFVWCVHSQNCLGPDREVAAWATCVAGRSCYES